ncbi:MAG TPA: YbhB/YbcL family Raf kinase inhibitor-like protein [Terriglobia bacterium]|nr:YbhB/YbcL family Raf kinase inhibitor-like protein [Terriglobia bacterium]
MFQLTSAAFRENTFIPRQYTCDGNDISVPLRWTVPPEGTKSFALIVDDPDAPAGVWVHWVLYDLPPELRSLDEGIPATDALDNGARQGVNDFHRMGYGGPCPPRGPAHHYVMTLYALDTMTGLNPGATRAQLLQAMKGHILGETRLTGLYGR